VETTDGCYSEEDSQGLSGCSKPCILGILTISLSIQGKLDSQLELEVNYDEISAFDKDHQKNTLAIQ